MNIPSTSTSASACRVLVYPERIKFADSNVIAEEDPDSEELSFNASEQLTTEDERDSLNALTLILLTTELTKSATTIDLVKMIDLPAATAQPLYLGVEFYTPFIFPLIFDSGGWDFVPSLINQMGDSSAPDPGTKPASSFEIKNVGKLINE
ncbi:hypothetical protein CEXT_582331 [Caerostris extrusa]|uniref:Uncharacterized protein n=1 Tax=Caerostris extrusa TaxID=172846 RepID=A0AAV4UB56_CAEEX|nr:hypothetical protein CEXT_582331 [Caerostris extrusa]